MNQLAMWIGYAVMTAGGVGIALAALRLALEGCWRMWACGLDIIDIVEAVAEWKLAHPEKSSRSKTRNGSHENV
jgi:hypothetical protein